MRTTAQLYDYVAEDTGLDRAKCKAVIYGLLYGHIGKTCINTKATLDEVVAIRVAFDDFIEGRV